MDPYLLKTAINLIPAAINEAKICQDKKNILVANKCALMHLQVTKTKLLISKMLTGSQWQ
jgi:hypothetical protein